MNIGSTNSPASRRSPFPRRTDGFLRISSAATDGLMCILMNLIQWRRRGETSQPESLCGYLGECSTLTREEFFSVPEAKDIEESRGGRLIRWRSPLPCPHEKNQWAFARVFPCSEGASAPTVILLHALMSANDRGYRKVAARFNARGWNAVFPHLPFHYSRNPSGFLNGELAVTSDLIRNAETLRRAVGECRQLMSILRLRGCREFGVLGTSYGGWTGALLSFLEDDLRFLALVQPIVDTELAIWENPGTKTMRSQLRAAGVSREVSTRHSHLTSPMHGVPRCGGDRVILTAGEFDSVSPVKALALLQNVWKAKTLITVPQGHFGYRAIPETVRAIERAGFLETPSPVSSHVLC